MKFKNLIYIAFCTTIFFSSCRTNGLLSQIGEKIRFDPVPDGHILSIANQPIVDVVIDETSEAPIEVINLDYLYSNDLFNGELISTAKDYNFILGDDNIANSKLTLTQIILTERVFNECQTDEETNHTICFLLNDVSVEITAMFAYNGEIHNVESSSIASTKIKNNIIGSGYHESSETNLLDDAIGKANGRLIGKCAKIINKGK